MNWGIADPGSLRDPRHRLLRILAAHHPADEKEAADLLLIRRMILAHDDIFSPECEPGHITASALVLDVTCGALLFHFHKRLKRWLQVGGHVDEGETDPAQTALREATEETGLVDLAFFPTSELVRPLDIDAHLIPATGRQAEHMHLDFRYLLSTSTPDAVLAGENESGLFRWISLDEIQPGEGSFDPGLERLVRKSRSVYEGRDRRRSR